MYEFPPSEALNSKLWKTTSLALFSHIYIMEMIFKKKKRLQCRETKTQFKYVYVMVLYNIIFLFKH